jgi:hypothetical protein
MGKIEEERGRWFPGRKRVIDFHDKGTLIPRDDKVKIFPGTKRGLISRDDKWTVF